MAIKDSMEYVCNREDVRFGHIKVLSFVKRINSPRKGLLLIFCVLLPEKPQDFVPQASHGKCYPNDQFNGIE